MPNPKLLVPKTRISVYIEDGFNLYHSTLQFSHPDCRRLNLLELSHQFINPNTEEVTEVYYFSALAEWLPSKSKKHIRYINALRSVGVKVILGKFTEKDKKCPLCRGSYKTHEEKKTDINIALAIVSGAVQDLFDTALIMSGDSDLSPVTAIVKKLCPAKRVGIVIPQNQYAVNLKQNSDFH
ncbi:MAG: NYN domain-containing protein [Spirochaetales bacterium]|jgi:uncharacterized LabA/DUF88 family protein|nr:NYN domain-containing protein [Spirochaetales bacterium]